MSEEDIPLYTIFPILSSRAEKEKRPSETGDGAEQVAEHRGRRHVASGARAADEDGRTRGALGGDREAVVGPDERRGLQVARLEVCDDPGLVRLEGVDVVGGAGG